MENMYSSGALYIVTTSRCVLLYFALRYPFAKSMPGLQQNIERIKLIVCPKVRECQRVIFVSCDIRFNHSFFNGYIYIYRECKLNIGCVITFLWVEISRLDVFKQGKCNGKYIHGMLLNMFFFITNHTKLYDDTRDCFVKIYNYVETDTSIYDTEKNFQIFKIDGWKETRD